MNENTPSKSDQPDQDQEHRGKAVRGRRKKPDEPAPTASTAATTELFAPDPAPAKRPSTTVRMHLWFQCEEGMLFGIGRLLLLDEIERSGSLKVAAERMNMSYRAAWGKIKASEHLLGKKLIEKPAGNRSGYSLTPYGAELRDRFRLWFAEVEAMALARARELFDFDVDSFG